MSPAMPSTSSSIEFEPDFLQDIIGDSVLIKMSVNSLSSNASRRESVVRLSDDVTQYLVSDSSKRRFLSELTSSKTIFLR